MAEYKVSVVVPIYNAEKTLRQCIGSILRQSLDGVQLVLIDDGSTDASAKILGSYSGRKDIAMVRQENAGVSAARNRGIGMSGGKYIFFLDSDDYIEDDVLERMWAFAEENGLDLVSCSHTEYNATLFSGNSNNAESFIARTPQEIGRHFMDVFPKSACAKLFRKSLIVSEKICFPEEMRLGEDLYFSYSYILRLSGMGKVKDAFYRIQNVNPLSLSKQYVPHLEMDIIKQVALWDALVQAYPAAERAYYQNNMDIRISLSADFFNNLYKQDCPLRFLEKRQVMKQYLSCHKGWIADGGKGIKNAKNTFQRITGMVLKTRCPVMIGTFFRIKEYIKKRKAGRNMARGI